MKALITNVNNPNVMIFIGKENKRRIGLKKVFSNPKTKETIRAVQKLLTLIPDKR